MSDPLPDLPEFDIRETDPKPMTMEEFYPLCLEGRRRLLEAGKLEEILDDPRREPVNKPFRLV